MEHEKLPKYVGIRGERYVYAKYYEQIPPFEYLHDLQEDPLQLKNMKDNPEYNTILNTLRVECEELEEKLRK